MTYGVVTAQSRYLIPALPPGKIIGPLQEGGEFREPDIASFRTPKVDWAWIEYGIVHVSPYNDERRGVNRERTHQMFAKTGVLSKERVSQPR